MSYSLRPAARAARILASISLLAVVGAVALLPSRAVRADIVVTAGADKTVNIWSPKDGSKIKSFAAHDGAVNVVIVSPDGKTIITGGADKKVKIWNATDYTLVKSIDAHDGEVTSLAFAPDGKKFVSGGADKKIKIWNLDGTAVKTIDAHDSAVIGLFVIGGATGQMTISGGADGAVKVWDGDNNMLIEIPTEHTGGLHALSGNPAAQCIYTAGGDGKIKYWSQAGTGVFEGEQGSSILTLAVAPDFTKLLSGGADGKVKIWNTDTHKLLATIDDVSAGGVNAIAFTPDGKMIITGGADKKVKAWSADGKLLHSIDVDGAVKVIVYHKDSAPKEEKKAEAK